MKSNISRATLVRPVALLACEAAMLILVLLISGQSEARVVKDQAASGAIPPAAVRYDKAGSVASSAGAGLAMPKIPPFAVVTNSFNLVPGQAYSLIYSDTTLGRSAFGIPDFNGRGGTIQTLRAWVACGYNPLADIYQWPAWCPQYANVEGAAGPTEYWLGSKYPLDGPYVAPNLLSGEGLNGWWLTGQGNPDSDPGTACLLVLNFLSGGQQDDVIPMVDMRIGSGQNSYFHLRALYTFHIRKSYAVCNPPPGESMSWYIEGVFLPK